MNITTSTIFLNLIQSFSFLKYYYFACLTYKYVEHLLFENFMFAISEKKEQFIQFLCSSQHDEFLY